MTLVIINGSSIVKYGFITPNQACCFISGVSSSMPSNHKIAKRYAPTSKAIRENRCTDNKLRSWKKAMVPKKLKTVRDFISFVIVNQAGALNSFWSTANSIANKAITKAKREWLNWQAKRKLIAINSNNWLFVTVDNNWATGGAKDTEKKLKTRQTMLIIDVLKPMRLNNYAPENALNYD